MHKISPKIKTAYNYLQDHIEKNNLLPGDQLPAENELAGKIGVSRPTVSKAVNLLIEKGLAYRKAGIGTFVRSGPQPDTEEKLIGLLFPLLGRGEIFRPITEEIAKLSEQQNFSLIWGGQVSNTEMNSRQMEQMVEFYIDRKVDGILIAPIELSCECFKINRKIISRIESRGIPIVFVDADYFEYPKRSSHDLVCIDNCRAGYISAEHFLKQGAKRVDFLKSPYMAQTVPQRIMGYQQALINYGVPPSSGWIHDIDDFSSKSMKNLMEKGAQNIICANDDLAMRAIKGLRDIGVDIPQEIRISGFDNLEFAKYLGIPLTTVAQPCPDLARIIINTMLQRIQSPAMPIRTIMLAPQFKERESSIIPKQA